jgi:hypothetical protein
MQKVPQSLWNGLFQAPEAPAIDPSLSAMMQLHQQRMDPRLFLREINPGATWGGRDRNAMQPNDLMQMYFSPTPSENM